MRVFRMAITLLASAMIFLAPMLCVRFCQLKAEVAASAPLSFGEMALHHAPEYVHEHTHAHANQAPLNELQQMVTSVTEFLPAVALLAVLLTVATARIVKTRLPRALAFDVITPPPRVHLACL